MHVHDGAVVHVSGGSLGSFVAYAGSTVDVFGGNFRKGFTADNEAVVSVHGGSFRGLTIEENSILEAYDVKRNGVPLAGLSQPGDEVLFESLYPDVVLTGTLADGTPFAFMEGDSLRNIRIRMATPVPTGPTEINVPSDPVPYGVRSGQTLRLAAGGAIPVNFNAGEGSTVIIEGGAVGENLEAVGATVTISGGEVGDDLDALSGSTIKLEGGRLGSDIRIYPGASLQMTGGELGDNVSVSGGSFALSGGQVGMHLTATANSLVQISGGKIDSNLLVRSSTVEITGGEIGSLGQAVSSTVVMSGGRLGSYFEPSNTTFTINGGVIEQGFKAINSSQVTIRGGAFDDNIDATSSSVTIEGVDFKLDGVPVAGLAQIGDSATLNSYSGKVLTGVLADGTPFAFSSLEGDDLGSPKVKLAAQPAAGPATIHLPGDSIPIGVRAGQTLHVAAGGALADNFSAGQGSVVNLSGGTVGDNFEAIGATVNFTGGMLESNFDAFPGTTVNIQGGAIGSRFKSYPGSHIVVTAADFMVDGAPVAGLGQAGDVVPLNLVSGATLSARLADGELLVFSSTRSDSLANGTLELRLADVAPPTPMIYNVPGDAAPTGVFHGQTIHFLPGASLLAEFDAGPGATVNLAGGVVGQLQAVGADVHVTSGEIRTRLNAYYGTTVDLSGGLIGRPYTLSFINKGATFNVEGGQVQGDVRVNEGGTLNLSGGAFDGNLQAYGAATVNIEGTQFFLDGHSIAGLDAIGTSLVFTARNYSILSGTLLDGHAFNITLGAPFSYPSNEWVDTRATLRLTLRAIPGDANLDQVVDIFDINVISDHWNQTGPAGDVNGDGIVDIFDVNVISDHWGQTVSGYPGGASGSATAVPEPTCLGLVATTFALAVALYRRNQKP